MAEKLRAMKLPKVADWLTESVGDTLTFYHFPSRHWRRIRTNNPLERLMREIRRRTRVVGAFPDGESALNLAVARLRYAAGSRWSTRRYLNMDLLREQDLQAAQKGEATTGKQKKEGRQNA